MLCRELRKKYPKNKSIKNQVLLRMFTSAFAKELFILYRNIVKKMPYNFSQTERELQFNHKLNRSSLNKMEVT